MVKYDNKFKTEGNKIKTKDKPGLLPQHIHRKLLKNIDHTHVTTKINGKFFPFSHVIPI